jgi:hypothetical protein
MPAVDSAEGKSAQRRRNVDENGKPLTRSGSSGSATKVQHMPSKLWDEIEDEVVHLTDIAGRISHSQVGAAGQMVATLSVPLAYAHDLLDVHMKANDGMVYMRMYYVSLADYLGEMDDDELDEDDPYALDGDD